MKYKYIVNWYYVPRDRAGNVYSYFVIADTRSGRFLYGKDQPESNLRAAMFNLNGSHKQNYWFECIAKKWHDYASFTKNVPYIGDIPAAFREVMRSRKQAPV